MIPIIGAMLAEKGISLLGDLINKGGDKVLEVVAEKTGIDLKSTPALTPEQTLALKQFESGEEFKKLQLEFDYAKLGVEDNKTRAQTTISAQDMQKAALQQEDVFSKRFVYYFSAAWSIFSMILIPCMIFGDIPVANQRFADTILGFMLGTAIASMFQFFLGSSMGSRKAQEAMLGGK